MKKSIFFLFLSFFGLLDAQNCMQYSPVADEYMVSSVNMELAAQIITMDRTLTSFEISLELLTCKVNGLCGAQLDIVAVKDGMPELTNILGSAKAPESEIFGVPNCDQNIFKPVVFRYNAITLQNTQKYALVLRVADAKRGDLYWRRSCPPADPVNPYSGGSSWIISESMGMMEGADLDLQFKICETKTNVCAALMDLKNRINSSGLSAGIATSLTAKVEAAWNLMPVKPKSSVTQLQAFLDLLKTVKIPPVQKTEYEAKAKLIMGVLNSGIYSCNK